MTQEALSYDVVIVGAGPAGLAAAIRLKQQQTDLRVCIVEKSAQLGGHILSGAIINPIALNTLLPDWQSQNPPPITPVTKDRFYMLTRHKSIRLPTPGTMKNHGNFMVSLSNLCKWLGTVAQSLGVEIYPGFPATDILTNEEGRVTGIKTGDMGVAKDGTHKANYMEGVQINAIYTLVAEGCRGSLAEKIMAQYQLRQQADPQTYAIGLKEVWEIPEEQHQEGHALHSVGWPLDNRTYGGTFIYHMTGNQIALGLAIGLDYANPYLNSFAILQQFKTHPLVASILKNGKRLCYGSRALNEGGYQSLPQLLFPGGALLGCSAGFMDVPKIKGSHTAMQSGIFAADAIVEQMQSDTPSPLLEQYPTTLTKSWVYKDLYKSRNIRPSFHKFGLFGGLCYSAIDHYLLRGRAPWTFHHKADHEQLTQADKATKPSYPEYDKTLTFDLSSSLYLSNTNHEEDQPCHLTLKDDAIPLTVNWENYKGPESYYCPAGVYEYLEENGTMRLQINAQNCLHCKTCDIKDPSQNITWIPPEGGGGPNYENM